MSAKMRLDSTIMCLVMVVLSVKSASDEENDDKQYYRSLNVSKRGKYELNGDYIKFVCVNTYKSTFYQDFNVFKKFKRTISPTIIETEECEPPKNMSYAKKLSVLNINITNLKTLIISLPFQTPTNNYTANLTSLLPEHFADLKISELSIKSNNHNTKITVDFLRLLPELEYLILDNFLLNPLPESAKVKRLKLKDGASIGPFGECSNLESLSLDNWEINNYNSAQLKWLAKCPKTKNLVLERIKLVNINLLLSSVFVNNLTARYCDLTDLPYEIYSPYIENLDYSHNRLEYFTLYYTQMWRLKTLDLSYNNLVLYNEKTGSAFHFNGADSMRSYGSTWRELREINLAHNPRYNFCDEVEAPLTGFNRRIPAVKKLLIAATNVSRICFKKWRQGSAWKQLEYLDLTHNNIIDLNIGDLIYADDTKIKLDLKENPLQNVHFSKNDYEDLKKELQLQNKTTILLDSKFDCDCKNAWLARAIREGLLSIETAICIDGRELSEVLPEQLECNKTENNGCVLRRAWKNNTVSVNCSKGELTSLPQESDLEELFVANNKIIRIAVDNLPETLKVLDIRSNRITRIEESVAKTLFERPRRILLSGNPLLCDCGNKYFIEQLQYHKEQVEDYENLTCADTNLAISLVIPDELCSVLPLPIILSVCIVGAVTVIGFMLYRLYGHNIKIFLFVHGWCLFFVREDDVDADRRYDAFISFTHPDHEFVTNELIEGLEPEYKICIHYRDFHVGEWIPNQIENFVQLSKRTIIVLSRNYLESTWGMFEFRTAHASAIKEGRSRIIMIVLDDVIDAKMEVDLRQFVSNNTYLEWGDPWFWQKLRYALPHVKKEIESTPEPACYIRNAIEMTTHS